MTGCARCAPSFPVEPETVHWNIPDPAAGQPDDDASYPAFQQTAAELDTRIGFLLAALADRTPRPLTPGRGHDEAE